MIITRFCSGYFGSTIYSILDILIQCGILIWVHIISLITPRLGFSTTASLEGADLRDTKVTPCPSSC